MKEDICKWRIRYWLICKIYKELLQLNTKQTIQLKNRQKNWRNIFPKKIDGQPAHEKTFHITNHQGSVNQNNKVSPYTSQKGYYQKDKK